MKSLRETLRVISQPSDCFLILIGVIPVDIKQGYFTLGIVVIILESQTLRCGYQLGMNTLLAVGVALLTNLRKESIILDKSVVVLKDLENTEG